MINLIPPQMKQSYRYARRNYHLFHWMMACLTAIIGAVFITGFGLLHIQQASRSYEQQVATARQNLAAQNFSQVQAEVKDMSNNLQLATQVLSKQVLFSELLQRLGTIMPSETILTNLTISQSQKGINVTAKAKTYTAATQLQVNMTDKQNELFSKADIVSISCSGVTAYPCSVSISAQFAPNNPFLFVSNNGAKK